jgi:tRNA A-37 threonylcarbamoyl transferase component Bud32
MLLGGRYAIERELGRGASAFVYLARDLKDERPVAVKVLRPELAESLGAERFLREIKTTRRLDHPYILPVLDEGAEGGRLYFVTPYMDGGTLRERLTRERQMPIPTATAVAQAMARALEHAHGHGIIHRDVKPENILFAGDEPRLADFGIARVLDDALGWTTSTGMVRGTPAYLSPEQAAGERDLDGRSDVYALGLVLYEMLAGVTPFPAATPAQSIAQRMTHPPEALTRYRPMVPADLEEVVQIALATTPADRFATARAFAEALAASGLAHSTGRAAISLSGGGRSVWARAARSTRLRLIAAALTVAGAGGGALHSWRAEMVRRASAASVDTTVLLVLPPELAPGARGTINVQTAERMYDAFRRWQGLTLVDAFRVNKAVRRDPEVAHDDPALLARTLGAGRFVRTQITPLGDSLSVYAAIYDAAGDRVLYQTMQRLPGTMSQGAASAKFESVADSLLLRGPPPPGGELGTVVLPAAQAMVRARAALDSWDLSTADSALASALQYDGQAPRVAYWLAQTRAWEGHAQAKWSELADRAVLDTLRLASPERLAAMALAALGREEYDTACALYASARLQRPAEFAGWYGLAQCFDLDHEVVRDSRSPSSWRFRRSYWRAMEAYERALVILPVAHRGFQRQAFQQLRKKFFTSVNDARQGFERPRGNFGSDRMHFLARPALQADTLAFIPYPLNDVVSAAPGTTPATLGSAISVGRKAFHRIAAAWAAALPRSPVVKQAIATSLDLLGDPTAADTLALARTLTADPTLSAQLAVDEVLVRIKFALPDRTNELRLARSLADSLLQAHVGNRRLARLLVPIAAVTGQCAQAAQLARNGAEALQGTTVIPAPMVAELDVLLVKAALGCTGTAEDPSIDALASRLPRNAMNIAGGTPYLFLGRTVALRFGRDSALLAQLAPQSKDYVLRAELALLAGDSASVRKLLAAAIKGTGSLASIVATPDAALPEARLWIAIGDTTSAERLLDAALRGVRESAPGALADPAVSGSLIAIVKLRSEIGLRRGAPDLAQRWTSALRALGIDADSAAQRARPSSP